MRLARRLLLSVLLLAAAYGSRGWWLPSLGNFLIQADDPVKADMIVVLGGDWYGNRVLKGGELVRQGYAPKALVSGPPHHYGVPECDLAIALARRHGYPEEYFERYPLEANSTVEEAGALAQSLRARGARRILVVTSDYHTRRAGRIWREAAPYLDIRMVASKDKHFHAESWWTSREGQKIWLMEWAKVLTSLFGL